MQVKFKVPINLPSLRMLINNSIQQSPSLVILSYRPMQDVIRLYPWCAQCSEIYLPWPTHKWRTYSMAPRLTWLEPFWILYTHLKRPFYSFSVINVKTRQQLSMNIRHTIFKSLRAFERVRQSMKNLSRHVLNPTKNIFFFCTICIWKFTASKIPSAICIKEKNFCRLMFISTLCVFLLTFEISSGL